MPLVRSPGGRGGRRGPVVTVGAVTLAGLVVLVVALALRLDAGSGERPHTRFARAPQLAPLPHPVGLQGWNGAAFVHDNLWTEGDRQFAVWVDGRGSPVVGRRQGADGGWHTVDLGRLADNPLGAPTAPDHHRVYVVAVDRAGYVHVAGNMHSDRLRYLRSERPFEIDSWVRAEMVGTDEQSVTYPAFVRAPGGDLLFFYRDGTAGDGDVLLNRLDRGSGEWRRMATVIDGRSSGESPYLQRVAVDHGRGTIHLVFLWRAGADADSNRDVSYLRSVDGGTTWQASDGSPRSLPVTHRTAEVIAPTTRRGPVLLNQGGLAVDPEGRPHAVFRVHRRGSSPVMHVWHDGGRWRADPLSGLRRMTGRPALAGDGLQPLLLLWSERGGDEQLVLRAAGLEGPRTAGAVSLGRLAVEQWEPTFDSAAVGHSQLRMLLPRRLSSPGQVAEGVVVTWPLAGLR